MIEIIIAIGVSILAGGGTYFAIKRKNKTKKNASVSSNIIERNLDQLIPEDVIIFFNEDYLVEGVANVEEEAKLCLKSYYLIRENSNKYLFLLNCINGCPFVFGELLKENIVFNKTESIDFDGICYERLKKGQGKLNLQGNWNPLISNEFFEFYIYSGIGEKFIIVLTTKKDHLIWICIKAFSRQFQILPSK